MMRTLGIDLGLKRIGLAYSPDEKVVVPLSAVLRKNRDQAAQAVRSVIEEWNVEKVVVGIPLGGSSEDEMRRRIKHFMGLVAFKGEIAYADESGSSLEAEELIKGEMRHVKDGRIDSIAAMIILKRYLKII